MKHIRFILAVCVLAVACKGKEKKTEEPNVTPVITNNGSYISFPDTTTLKFFKTEKVDSNSLHADFNAVGRVGAIITASNTGAAQNIVLFDNPDLASNYTQLIAHKINIRQIENINIKQKQIELNRTQDLQSHGAATGQDLLNAQTGLSMEQTNLANEKAALIEHEARLKASGFEPDLLRQSAPGTAFVICDVPENQMGNIKVGAGCKIMFTSFPNEPYTGIIEKIADVVDNSTRMIKVRIRVQNSSNKIKAGMFANLSFVLNAPDNLTVDKAAIITVQGNNYVFVKKAVNEFERVPVNIGEQIGDRVIIYSGLANGSDVAVEGAIQLKGLSFGY